MYRLRLTSVRKRVEVVAWADIKGLSTLAQKGVEVVTYDEHTKRLPVYRKRRGSR